MDINKKQKKQSFLFFVLSILVIAAVYFFYDFKTPRCVNAQTCYNVYPYVEYWWTGRTSWNSSQACVVASVNKSWPGFTFTDNPRNYVLALTGWYLHYTASGDEHLKRARTMIDYSTLRASGSTIMFNIDVCLHDDNVDNAHEYQVYFVLYAWQ
ncbi:MAG TPA: hypothetical protein VI749_05520 [Candidatus Omnitrophota bacterium]|nr:hypothetical protein [Candidatus Omnitrophota bacterium]